MVQNNGWKNERVCENDKNRKFLGCVKIVIIFFKGLLNKKIVHLCCVTGDENISIFFFYQQ